MCETHTVEESPTFWFCGQKENSSTVRVTLHSGHQRTIDGDVDGGIPLRSQLVNEDDVGVPTSCTLQHVSLYERSVGKTQFSNIRIIECCCICRSISCGNDHKASMSLRHGANTVANTSISCIRLFPLDCLLWTIENHKQRKCMLYFLRLPSTVSVEGLRHLGYSLVACSLCWLVQQRTDSKLLSSTENTSM